MPRPKSKRINRERYDAVLFDLDGVITNTATLHATCGSRCSTNIFAGTPSKWGAISAL